jgi:hypothetical protein
MMRNTSPIGWIPLLFIKIIYEKTFTAYLISAFVVALPLMVGCVYIDSWFYY